MAAERGTGGPAGAGRDLTTRRRDDRAACAAARAVPLLLVAGLLGGCLGEPEIQDRWTRLDILSASVTPYQALPAGSADTFRVSTAITYRSILTGFAVCELRSSGTVSGGSVTLQPDASRLPMAHDIDRILQNSVSLGRATRAVTGWDHLIQHIDFAFSAGLPAGADSASTPAGLFLLVYLGEGDEVERQDGTDTLIVTPFPSDPYEILPVGLELGLAVPGTP
jgi:hypothetical protein